MDQHLMEQSFAALHHTPMVELPDIEAVYQRALTRTLRQRGAAGVAGIACLGLLLAAAIGVSHRDDPNNVVARQGQTPAVTDLTSAASPSVTGSASPQPSGSTTSRPSTSNTPGTAPNGQHSGWKQVGFQPPSGPGVDTVGSVTVKDLVLHMTQPSDPAERKRRKTTTLTAYRANTGEKVWQETNDFGGALSADPAGDVVAYFHSPQVFTDDPESGKQLVVRDAVSGGELWRAPAVTGPVVEQQIHASSVEVHGDSVVMVEQNALTVLDARTGAKRWTTNISGLPDLASSYLFTSTQASDTVLTAIAADEADANQPLVVRLSMANGKILSHAKVRMPLSKTTKVEALLLADLGEDVLLKLHTWPVDGEPEDTLCRVRVADGSLVWQKHSIGEDWSADVDNANAVMVVNTSNGIAAYGLSSGSQRWTANSSSMVYATTEGQTFLAKGAAAKRVAVLSNTTGREQSSLPLGQATHVNDIVATDSGVVVSTESGTFFYANNSGTAD